MQDYCNAHGINLGLRKVSAARFGQGTFYLSTFATASTARITLGGNDWSYFFANQSFAGTNEDTSKNRKFTISDGISNVEIVLNYDDINIDGLLPSLNHTLIKGRCCKTIVY